MKSLFSLALASAWNRRATLGLMAISIALSVMLLLGVEQLRTQARDSFSQSISGTDLVAGARTSPIQLMLYAVFRLGDATHNIRWASFEAMAAHPSVAWAVPISLGDSHRGFAVIGTTSAYFEHFRYGDRRLLAFAAGKPFTDIFDAVIGADVAAKLGYQVGDRIVLNHGAKGIGLTEHADKPFTVSGILKRTGLPVDRSVHVGLEAIEAIHLDWQGGAPMPGVSIPAEYVRKFDLAPKEITAALIGLKSRAGVFQMQRFINQYKGEPLLAVLPGVALDELWSIVSIVEQSLLAISVLVVAVGLSGLVAVVLAGLGERRRELAILRSVGAGPRVVFLLLAIEGLMVVMAGALLGVLGLTVLSLFAAPVLEAHLGISLAAGMLSAASWQLLLLVMITGFLVSLIPGYRAYRLSLTDGLTPRL
ncbi:ABC transporter permease [Nitrosospira lacus]|uniref:Peptide ABC transporter permease n=1 Tax=Nitrosospira lacus TaxID=1288494 RepID=A0A1W6SQL9_9PROT|nr:ABC transporter permease [Nitrosospira lacus]